MQVAFAPIKSEIVDGNLAKGEWQSWLGSVGTALRGEWRKQAVGGVGKCAVQGCLMVVSFDWSSYPTADVTLPVQVENGVLQMYAENGTFLVASLVSGKTISIPTSTHTGRTIATGVFVVKEAS